MIIKNICDNVVTKQYELGDRVRIRGTQHTLTIDREDLSVIKSIHEDTGEEYVEPTGHTKAEMPKLISEWKTNQMKKLIGI